MIYIVCHLHILISNYRVGFIWLGMTYTADGMWIWDDGTEMSNAHWYSGELCNALHYKGWQDHIYRLQC